MNVVLKDRSDKSKIDKDLMKKFNSEIDKFIYKIDKSISDFKFNVCIAHFYEIYNFFNKHIMQDLSNECLKKNITKIMKLMLPFTPHLAYECLEMLNCKKPNEWPEVKENFVESIKFAVQVNGKTKDIITIMKNTEQDIVNKIILEKSKAKKFINKGNVQKTIFVKDKIINYIVK